MKLAVLNPGGHDPEQPFPDFAGDPGAGAHAPVNYHGYAACTGGSFHRDVEAIDAKEQFVLLLLRRDLKKAMTALKRLKASGRTVAVSWKESGIHQVASQLDDAENLALFREICTLADGALSSTPELVPVYRGAGAQYTQFIPTPYPVDDPRWDFSVSVAERDGVFIGTREFDVPSRNHAAALLAAREFDCPVTVINRDGRRGRKKIEAILGGQPGQLHVVETEFKYTDWLRMIAGHRLVFQLDHSAVPGQLAGDALLCRIPCVGGDGAVDREAFGTTHDVHTLLADDAAYAATVNASQERALKQIAFPAVSVAIKQFFMQIA